MGFGNPLKLSVGPVDLLYAGCRNLIETPLVPILLRLVLVMQTCIELQSIETGLDRRIFNSGRAR
jgi:hypothetical protein